MDATNKRTVVILEHYFKQPKIEERLLTSRSSNIGQSKWFEQRNIDTERLESHHEPSERGDDDEVRVNPYDSQFLDAFVKEHEIKLREKIMKAKMDRIRRRLAAHSV